MESNRTRYKPSNVVRDVRFGSVFKSKIGGVTVNGCTMAVSSTILRKSHHDAGTLNHLTVG